MAKRLVFGLLLAVLLSPQLFSEHHDGIREAIEAVLIRLKMVQDESATILTELQAAQDEQKRTSTGLEEALIEQETISMLLREVRDEEIPLLETQLTDFVLFYESELRKVRVIVWVVAAVVVVSLTLSVAGL